MITSAQHRLVRHQDGNVIEWRYAEPLPPGEDGTPQTLSAARLNLFLGLISLVVLAMWIYWAVKAWRAHS